MFANKKKKRDCLRIAFNDIGGDSWTGGITYRRNLLKSIRTTYPNIEIFIITESPEKYNDGEYDKVIQYKQNTTKFSGIFHRISKSKFLYDISLKRAIKSIKGGVDVIFPSEYSIGKGTASILWIPDFQILHLPDFFSNHEVENYKDSMRKLIRGSPLVVLSSYDAQKDFQSFYSEAIEKTRVMQFVAHIPENLYDSEPYNELKRYNIPERFIYVPNQFWAHKNHLLLLDAMKILKDKGIEPFIVFTGNPTDVRNPKYLIKVLEKIALHNLSNQISLLGFVLHEHVYSLIRQSICVCNPSLFEGWSTPVEETKSVGKRMLLSDLPVHIEQSPPNTLYFDRHSSEDLAEKLGLIWSEASHGPDLVMESEARKLLPSRMEKFADTFIDICEEVTNL